jgi:uncharacterized protein (TIRG00374 family)
MQRAPEAETPKQGERAAGGKGERFNSLLRKLIFVIPVGVMGNIIFSYVAAGGATMHSVGSFSPHYLILALCMGVVPWFTGSLRLFLWCRFLGKHIRYRDAVNIAITSDLGAAVSPPLVGGGPVKVGMLMQQGLSGAVAFSLTTLENFEDAVFFLLMAPVALAVSGAGNPPFMAKLLNVHPDRSLLIVPAAACVILAVGATAARSRSAEIMNRFPLLCTVTGKIKSFAGQFLGTGRSIIRKGKALFLLTMTVTTVQWLCRYSIVTVLLLGLGIPVRPVLFMALQVIVFALQAFIPTPGGAGGAEALFAVVYRSYLPPGMIGVVTAGWRFITFYFPLLLAAAVVLLSGMRRKVRRSLTGNAAGND